MSSIPRSFPVTAASRSQLWLTALTCLSAESAIFSSDLASVFRSAIVIATALWVQRRISGEQYYWASESPELDQGRLEKIYLFGDHVETEVEAARERSYLSTASSTQRGLYITTGIAVVVFVTYLLKYISKTKLTGQDLFSPFCALTMIAAMTPRHFLVPTFVASLVVLVHWTHVPEKAGAFHLLTLFLTLSSLVSHEWIRTERSRANTMPFPDSTLLKSLLRDSAHVIVPMLMIGTLCSLVIPKTERKPRITQRLLEKSARLLAKPQVLPQPSPEAIEMARQIQAPLGTPGALESIKKARNLAKFGDLPPLDQQVVQGSIDQIQEGDLSALRSLAANSSGRPLAPGELQQAKALMDRLQSIDPSNTVQKWPELKALENKMGSSNELKELQRLADSAQNTPLTSENQKRAWDLLEQIERSSPSGSIGTSGNKKATESYEALKNRLENWASHKPSVSGDRTITQDDGISRPSTATPPPQVGSSTHRDAPSSPPEIQNGTASFAQAQKQAQPAQGDSLSKPTPLNSHKSESGSERSTQPTPQLPNLDAQRLEHLIKMIACIALALIVLHFITKIGKRIDQSKKVAREERKRRRAIAQELARLRNAKIPLHEEIERRYALFLEMMAASGNPRQEWLPAIDFSLDIRRQLPKISQDVLTITETFCDWRYGQKLPTERQADQFRKSFSRLSEWFDAAPASPRQGPTLDKVVGY